MEIEEEESETRGGRSLRARKGRTSSSHSPDTTPPKKKRKANKEEDLTLEQIYKQLSATKLKCTSLETIYEVPKKSKDPAKTIMSSAKTRRSCLLSDHYAPSKVKLKSRKDRARPLKRLGVKVPSGNSVSDEQLAAVLNSISDGEEEQSGLQFNLNVNTSAVVFSPVKKDIVRPSKDVPLVTGPYILPDLSFNEEPTSAVTHQELLNSSAHLFDDFTTGVKKRKGRRSGCHRDFRELRLTNDTSSGGTEPTLEDLEIGETTTIKKQLNNDSFLLPDDVCGHVQQEQLTQLQNKKDSPRDGGTKHEESAKKVGEESKSDYNFHGNFLCKSDNASTTLASLGDGEKRITRSARRMSGVHKKLYRSPVPPTSNSSLSGDSFSNDTTDSLTSLSHICDEQDPNLSSLQHVDVSTATGESSSRPMQSCVSDAAPINTCTPPQVPNNISHVEKKARKLRKRKIHESGMSPLTAQMNTLAFADLDLNEKIHVENEDASHLLGQLTISSENTKLKGKRGVQSRRKSLRLLHKHNCDLEQTSSQELSSPSSKEHITKEQIIISSGQEEINEPAELQDIISASQVIKNRLTSLDHSAPGGNKNALSGKVHATEMHVKKSLSRKAKRRSAFVVSNCLFKDESLNPTASFDYNLKRNCDELGSASHHGNNHELGSSSRDGNNHELGFSSRDGNNHELGSFSRDGNNHELGSSSRDGNNHELGSSSRDGNNHESGSTVYNGTHESGYIVRDLCLELGSTVHDEGSTARDEGSNVRDVESTARDGSTTKTSVISKLVECESGPSRDIDSCSTSKNDCVALSSNVVATIPSVSATIPSVSETIPSVSETIPSVSSTIPPVSSCTGDVGYTNSFQEVDVSQSTTFLLPNVWGKTYYLGNKFNRKLTKSSHPCFENDIKIERDIKEDSYNNKWCVKNNAHVAPAVKRRGGSAGTNVVSVHPAFATSTNSNGPKLFYEEAIKNKMSAHKLSQDVAEKCRSVSQGVSSDSNDSTPKQGVRSDTNDTTPRDPANVVSDLVACKPEKEDLTPSRDDNLPCNSLKETSGQTFGSTNVLKLNADSPVVAGMFNNSLAVCGGKIYKKYSKLPKKSANPLEKLPLDFL